MKMLNDRPYTTYSRTSPTWLSSPSSAVCFATGSMRIGNGTNRAEMK